MVKNISNNNPQPVHFFSSNLKYLLKKFGVNQIDLARFMDRQQTSVSNWVNGISVPDVDDLVKIYHYFGLGMDALILMDLGNSDLVTDNYVVNFKKVRQEKEEGAAKNILREPDPVFNELLLGQLKQLDAKLDNLQGLTKKLVDKEKKAREKD